MPKRSTAYMLEKKKQILRAALQVALKKGLAHTSLRDISEAVGMSMGSIANYFAKKQDIVAFAAEQSRAARQQDIDQLVQASDPQQALLNWFAALVEDDSFADSAVIELELVAEAFRSQDIGNIVRANALAVSDGLAQVVQGGASTSEAAVDRARIGLALYYGLAALKVLDISSSQEAVSHTLRQIFLSGDAQ